MDYSIAWKKGSGIRNNVFLFPNIKNYLAIQQTIFTLSVILLATLSGLGVATSVSASEPAEQSQTSDVAYQNLLFAFTGNSLKSVEKDNSHTEQETFTNTRDLYRARVHQLENNLAFNNYSSALTDAYIGLANSLANLEEYSEALGVYDKALQTIRSSAGLKSTQQLPILNAQLKSLENLHEWSQYDSTMVLIHQISTENFPAGNPARIHAVDQLGKWKIRLMNEGLLNFQSELPEFVAELYKREISMLKEADKNQVSTHDNAALHLGAANAQLAIVEFALNEPANLNSQPNQLGSGSQQVCQAVRFAGSGSQYCQPTGLHNLGRYRNAGQLKKHEMNFYLENLRNAILDAGEILDSPEEFQEREEMLNEFRNLAESFTELVSIAPSQR